MKYRDFFEGKDGGRNTEDRIGTACAGLFFVMCLLFLFSSVFFAVKKHACNAR
jgi:hypothetical protein